MAYDESSSGECDQATDDLSGEDSEDAFYTLSLATVSANSYTLRATPQAEHFDDACGDLKINNSDAKSVDRCSKWLDRG